MCTRVAWTMTSNWHANQRLPVLNPASLPHAVSACPPPADEQQRRSTPDMRLDKWPPFAPPAPSGDRTLLCLCGGDTRVLAGRGTQSHTLVILHCLLILVSRNWHRRPDETGFMFNEGGATYVKQSFRPCRRGGWGARTAQQQEGKWQSIDCHCTSLGFSGICTFIFWRLFTLTPCICTQILALSTPYIRKKKHALCLKVFKSDKFCLKWDPYNIMVVAAWSGAIWALLLFS